jgi:maltooligosyltrehalose trehalohydrolase
VHTFRVWAPNAERVDVSIDGGTAAMESTGDGWWEKTLEEAAAGTRYLFPVDGSAGRPDPRSHDQPAGVHGPSQVVDHARFAWTDHGWKGFLLPGSVLYELHLGTFSSEGTFEGVIEKIPHLVALGVDAIELMPVCEFSGSRGWGYDGVDLFAPHSAYGGPEGLKQLVDACHGAGLGVVMDVVYNHLGPAGNYLPEFGPYFSERHNTNWGAALNLDGPHSDEVRRFVIDNALMWLRDYHCDGLRLDAVHAIIDDSSVHILEQLATEVQTLAAHLGRPLWLMPESDLNDPKFVRGIDIGGFGLDASWADEWHHALHACLTGERGGYYEDFGRIAQLAKALKQAWVYDGIWSPHRQRTHGRHPGLLPGNRFVVSTQNHDQVGNRALGERSGALMSQGRLKIAAALLLTSPFIPLLFMGEEWAASTPFQYFTDHPDPELGRAVSEGRRREFAHFGWDPERVPDPQARATFERSKLDWSEPGTGFHLEMLEWYSELIALRRRLPALTDPRRDGIEVGYDEPEGWLLYRRGNIEVGANLGDNPVDLEVGANELLVGSEPSVRLEDTRLLLPPDSVAVLTFSS